MRSFLVLVIMILSLLGLYRWRSAAAPVSMSGGQPPALSSLPVLPPLALPQVFASTAVPSPTPGFRADLPDRGAAPEWNNTAFLNTERPLRLADLRGQVVLLEFWTFDCINCIRTIPYIQAWWETYRDQGLVVVGNHYPEFSYERDIHNVAAAAQRLGITYPIAQDNERGTWRAYNQRYWPTVYLIDKWGHIRYVKIGEGAYDTTEANIRALLAETYDPQREAATAEIRRTLTYITPTTGVNVRRTASVTADILGAITPGMVYIVQGQENGWYQIVYNGAPGFVSGDFVVAESLETASAR